ERRERAHEADEAADHDRLAAVPVEVVLDMLEALLGDPQTLPVAEHELAPNSPPDQEAQAVAGHRADPDDPDERNDRDRALARDDAAEDDRELPRLEEPHHADERVSPLSKRIGKMLDNRLETRDVRQDAACDHGKDHDAQYGHDLEPGRQTTAPEEREDGQRQREHCRTDLARAH